MAGRTGESFLTTHSKALKGRIKMYHCDLNWNSQFLFFPFFSLFLFFLDSLVMVVGAPTVNHWRDVATDIHPSPYVFFFLSRWDSIILCVVGRQGRLDRKHVGIGFFFIYFLFLYLLLSVLFWVSLFFHHMVILAITPFFHFITFSLSTFGISLISSRA